MSAKYTLHTYLKLDSNKVVKEAVEEVIEELGTAYNPLYLCGGHNSGKTHLLYAMQNVLKQQGKNVVYLDGEWFVKSVVNGIRYGNMKNFREKYRTTDVLLIDNIEKIAGRKSSQQELNFTMEELINSRKQVVITSRKNPNAVFGMDERLRSRLLAGLLLEIDQYSKEEKTAITMAIAKRSGITLDEKLAKCLMEHAYYNLSFADQYIETVCAKSESVTEENIMTYMGYDSKKCLTNLDCEKIVAIVSDYYQVDPKVIKSHSRNHEISLIRQIAMYLCEKLTDEDVRTISFAFNRNNSTVKVGIRRIETLIKENTDIRGQIEKISEILYFTAS